MIDWFDVAPAVAFAIVAGLAGRFIAGSAARSVVLGVVYIIVAGLAAAAAVAYVGLDGSAGFAASVVLSAILVAPIWLYARAADLTPFQKRRWMVPWLTARTPSVTLRQARTTTRLTTTR